MASKFNQVICMLLTYNNKVLSTGMYQPSMVPFSSLTFFLQMPLS